jgi:hypothetical protein
VRARSPIQRVFDGNVRRHGQCQRATATVQFWNFLWNLHNAARVRAVRVVRVFVLFMACTYNL